MSATPLHHALGLDDGSLLALVGGGGKTTLIFSLAAERTAPGPDPPDPDAPLRRGIMVLTTTTKFTIPAAARQIPLVYATNVNTRYAASEDAARRGKHAIIVGAGPAENGRIQGVEPDWPRKALAMAGVGLVAVEADGSAGRPFKAPAAHEPVIPDGVTHVCACLGVQVLGQPLDAAHVHRPERVLAIAEATLGVRPGDPVTPELIASVLAHPDGGRKQVPGEALFTVCVTSAARDPEGTKAIAAACHEAGIERVIAFDAAAGLVRRL